MAQFKVVFQFTQITKGWSELWYREANDLAAASVFSAQTINNLTSWRHPTVVLKKARISAETNNRITALIPINKSPFVNPLLPSPGGPDVTSTSCVLSISAPDTGGKRSIWLRGLIDNDVIRNTSTGQDQPSATLLNGVQAMIFSLWTDQYRVRSLTPLTAFGFQYQAIASVTVAGPGIVTINAVAPWAASPTGRVILSRIDKKLFPGLNGHWTYSAFTANTFQVPYNSHLPNGTYFLTRARWRPETYQYGQFTPSSVGFNQFSSRDTGRGPLGGRGRRSAQLTRLG